MKVNDVYHNRFNVPVISSPDLFAGSLVKDPVKVFVVINYNLGMGHTGLVVGEGEDALLHDPSGSYSECPSKQCYNNEYEYRTLRSSGEFFHYPEFDWDDYLSFQLWDGPDVQVIEFILPKVQADKITELIYNYGMADSFKCSDTVFKILKESGGIFNSLEGNLVLRENPWNLRHKLLDLYFPERGGVISGAY
ncbi:hypothetical protein L9H26_16535 [Morganella psychrotolerans]|uniref:Uncharacterized protein n=1 Tax=Morganella psychrotolerans TaxID=368603 RepID=A0A5M9QXZ0_9GAMM|nr:hypothetical protein [Morganella psychrotolerans]KAA8713280.1 hypothetical protein F4V73_17410 [Morganella psychrotolerans]OBU03617.1 hypothetical protein AYY16_14310 [Morganella psychrotolerans]